jgi:UDP-N-acetylmuramyl pentapeptide phosphotransferase/UDP-N-acetylglucosamine-1-phosphate transferase
MLVLFIAFGVAFALTLAIVRAARQHSRFLLDHDVSGPQKFHALPVPRVGGIGIVGALLAAAAYLYVTDSDGGHLLPLLLLCGVPTFAAGLVEDLFKSVTPRVRLLAAVASASLAFFLADGAIRRADIPGIDQLVAMSAGAFVLTVFAVSGISNAVNIIDGFNGLASMCVAIMLAALAYVAFQVGDTSLAMIALALIGAIIGFFLWNFPAGLIFLGDGGAYLLGFLVAELSLLLLVRNPSVSPLFPLLVVVYPVFETLFSIYRRRVLRALPPSLPDGIHLHSLVYRRLLSWAVGDRSAKALTRRNSMTSPYLWLLCTLSVVPGLLFWDNSAMLALFLLLFGVSYVALYRRIVRFRSPRWMVFGSTPRSTAPVRTGRRLRRIIGRHD